VDCPNFGQKSNKHPKLVVFRWATDFPCCVRAGTACRDRGPDTTHNRVVPALTLRPSCSCRVFWCRASCRLSCLAHLDIYRKNNKQLFMVTMESFCKQERRPRATTTTRRGKEPTHIPKTDQPTTPGPDSPNRISRVTNTLPNDLRGLNLQQRVHQERTDITERLTNHSLRRKREDAQ
jgi:hypothetical protein